MSDLTLNIEQPDDVTMPGCLMDSGLTLAQLGALFVFIAMEHGLATFEHPLMNSGEMAVALPVLRDRGILTAKLEGSTVRVVIDLDKAMP